ncbi:MAG: family 43 glycosylhydrolase [Clostridiales Family XIII bacterium]|nr:family 43 glycosylhydrolase [Clostridiales Family XIII bacterium]
MKKRNRVLFLLMAMVMIVGVFPINASAANPFLPLWERVPDGEPRVFTDPETGQERLYVYGSHDSRISGYCGPDHVVWSAPLDDPNDWRYDGEAFHVDQLNGVDYVDRDGITKQLIVDVDANIRVMLYAPDVVYHPENKKYYMYVFVDGMWHVNPDPPADMNRRRHPMFVVSSDSPAGPFGDPKFVQLAFDPAVLVDDVKNEDGKSRVFLYWTPEENRNLQACELDPDDMATILPGTMHYPLLDTAHEPMNTMPDWVAPFYMFEGSSMRKVNDTYIMAYCRAVRPTQTATTGISEIGWAYSDNPFGDPALGDPWIFGGVIVDNRGEQVADPYTGATTYTFTGGNVHGGMAKVNDQWYQIYHRSTNISSKRQAMAEPFDISFVDGKPVIEQVELTSQGFEINGLDPFKEQYAGYACYILPASGNASPQFFSQNNDANINFDPNAVRDDWYPVMNIRNHSWLGYKYFNFGDGAADGEQIKLVMTLTERAAGTVNIYAGDPKTKFSDPEQPKTLIGTMELDGADREAHKVEAVVDKDKLVGKKGIYLEFLSSQSGEICQINKLQFKLETPATYAKVHSSARVNAKLKAGEFQLLPDTDGTNYEFTSANTGIATVDGNGLVTLRRSGSVIITLRTTYGSNLASSMLLVITP